MSERKEKEESGFGFGWMVGAGLAIGAASLIGYAVGKISTETPQCSSAGSTTREQLPQSEQYRSKVVTCDKCSICLEDMDVAVLPCRHSFHKNCITKWLAMNGTCPTCRTPVF